MGSAALDEWYELDANGQVQFILARWETPERQEWVDRFIREHLSLIRRRAQREARYAELAAMDTTDLVDELVQEFVALILTMLEQEHVDPGPTHVEKGTRPGHGYSRTGSSWESVFSLKAHNIARSYIDVRAGNNLAGSNGAIRRKRFLATSRDQLRAELGREPTIPEVRERASQRASKRADATRQGMVFTSDGHSTRCLNPVTSHTPASDILQEVDGGIDEGFASLEARELADSVVEEAARRSRALGEIAFTWLSTILSGRDGNPMDWVEVALRMGLSSRQMSSARKLIGECLEKVTGHPVSAREGHS
jgi:hypothetical protein